MYTQFFSYTKMMKRQLVLAFFGFIGLYASGDGFRNPPDTAAALSKADNNMVWVDDASAVFENPANLVDVPAREIQLSSSVGYSHAEFDGTLSLYGQPVQTETDQPWGFLPAFSTAWPLHKKDGQTDWALGLGVHVPYGRQTRWESDGPFAVSSSMSVIDLSPVLSWRVTDSVSVGAGLDTYYGRLGYSQYLTSFPGAKTEADADGWALGGNAGVTWRITERQRLALTCRSPFDLTFRGHMKTANIPSPPLPASVPESDLDTTFKFPTIIALGYGIQITDTVRVETKIEWLEYSRNKTMAINAGENSALANFLGLANAPQNWNDTWTFGIAPEWRFATDWTLRAGYLYLQSPIPDETFAPTALDVDQSLVSVGLGYSTGRHAFDIAYALGIFNDRNVDASENPACFGSYAFEGHLVALTYTYAF